jgi:hypothetical protein
MTGDGEKSGRRGGDGVISTDSMAPLHTPSATARVMGRERQAVGDKDQGHPQTTRPGSEEWSLQGQCFEGTQGRLLSGLLEMPNMWVSPASPWRPLSLQGGQ